MDQALNFMLLLIALCSLSECIRHQYYYINMNKNWTEAQSYCRENYTDLATVNNMNDMKELMNTVNNNNVNVWIGLKNTRTHKWKWSLGDPVNYGKWENGQPNNTNDCAFMKNGTWDHENCSKLLSFMCYNDRLILIKENRTWSEALKYCRKNHMDLFSVHSNKIEKNLNTVVQQASTAEVWLGLRHSCTVGIWFWVSGEIVCYEKWDEGNETAVENCETVMRSGAVQSGGDHRWISLPETERRNFICSRYD
ncbi:C-type mannose receptor 2-like [Triplophysa dalaica]|uniref:C-type mannose receptor 2-like n=1 Tax=Triplophysa dalaica TaxID=1582913 RepID=UPI0024DFACA5|nr:C-type mannose receptor 2-like [Triplophysa dalaica]